MSSQSPQRVGYGQLPGGGYNGDVSPPNLVSGVDPCGLYPPWLVLAPGENRDTVGPNTALHTDTTINPVFRFRNSHLSQDAPQPAPRFCNCSGGCRLSTKRETWVGFQPSGQDSEISVRASCARADIPVQPRFHLFHPPSPEEGVPLGVCEMSHQTNSIRF